MENKQHNQPVYKFIGLIFWLIILTLITFILVALEPEKSPKHMSMPLAPDNTTHAATHRAPTATTSNDIAAPVRDGGYVVQIASYQRSAKDIAQNFLLLLNNEKQPVFFVDTATHLILRAGPFMRRQDAEQFIDWLKKTHNITDAYVIHQNTS